MVEREIIYIRSRFSPLLDPQKFSNLSIQTLSPSSIAQVERTQRSGETRGFRIIQEARSMNERLRKSIIFTKRHLSSPVFTYRGGQEKGTGGGRGQGGEGGRHRATDCRDCDTTSELSKDRNYRGYPSTVSKFQSNGFSLFARFDVAFRALKVSRIVSFCQHY